MTPTQPVKRAASPSGAIGGPRHQRQDGRECQKRDEDWLLWA
jgi:hypothetical protein